MIAKVIVIVFGVVVMAILYIKFVVWLHDFLDGHGIQCRACREHDRALGRPQKTPRWKAY